jgi:hypothetical protein
LASVSNTTRLQIRNDALTFESVRTTCCAQGSGLWYYEVLLVTNGVMQVLSP